MPSYAEMTDLAVEWEENRLRYTDQAEAHSTGGEAWSKDEGGARLTYSKLGEGPVQ